MENTGHFNIEINGKNYEAKIIMNFELYSKYYCVYGVENDQKEYNVYCGQIINNTVVPIQNEKDKELTEKIEKILVNSIKE